MLKQRRHTVKVVGLDHWSLIGGSGPTCLSDAAVRRLDVEQFGSLVLPGREDICQVEVEPAV
jgi:hypothetical protein